MTLGVTMSVSLGEALDANFLSHGCVWSTSLHEDGYSVSQKVTRMRGTFTPSVASE